MYALSSGAYAAIASFLVFSVIQFRDGPFIRPHPGLLLRCFSTAQHAEVDRTD